MKSWHVCSFDLWWKLWEEISSHEHIPRKNAYTAVLDSPNISATLTYTSIWVQHFFRTSHILARCRRCEAVLDIYSPLSNGLCAWGPVLLGVEQRQSIGVSGTCVAHIWERDGRFWRCHGGVRSVFWTPITLNKPFCNRYLSSPSLEINYKQIHSTYA